jgi:hypothetical protein
MKRNPNQVRRSSGKKRGFTQAAKRGSSSAKTRSQFQSRTGKEVMFPRKDSIPGLQTAILAALADEPSGYMLNDKHFAAIVAVHGGKDYLNVTEKQIHRELSRMADTSVPAVEFGTEGWRLSASCRAWWFSSSSPAVRFVFLTVGGEVAAEFPLSRAVFDAVLHGARKTGRSLEAFVMNAIQEYVELFEKSLKGGAR